MRKINVLFVAIIAMALMMGCKSAPRAQDPTVPEWLNEVPPEDVFWGIGTAKLQSGDSLSMETATTRAQRDIARQVQALVQGMLNDYSNEAGIVGEARALMAIENIGRNLVNFNLTGASPNKRDKMPDGTWWVRVYLRKSDAQRQISDFVNHEAADYAEFRADQALRQLDYQLQQTQSRPYVVRD